MNSGTRATICANASGTLLAFAFRVPKPPEQRRIVRLLQGVQAKQSDLRHLQAETDADLAAFTPALLAKAFRGEL